MRSFIDITKALSDATRVRALLSLRGGELCLCQVIEFLGLSPSTVSRHMDLLYRAGLVERRKAGRWHYFRLAGKGSPPAARAALRWVAQALRADKSLQADTKSLGRVRKKGLSEVSACYRAS